MPQESGGHVDFYFIAVAEVSQRPAGCRFGGYVQYDRAGGRPAHPRI